MNWIPRTKGEASVSLILISYLDNHLGNVSPVLLLAFPKEPHGAVVDLNDDLCPVPGHQRLQGTEVKAPEHLSHEVNPGPVSLLIRGQTEVRKLCFEEFTWTGTSSRILCPTFVFQFPVRDFRLSKFSNKSCEIAKSLWKLCGIFLLQL